MKNLLFTLSIVLVSVLPISVSASTTLEACMEPQCREYFKAYKILTKRGHSEAMATLGELYYAGYGTEKNTKQALKWFRRAAKFGVTTAQYKAGILYLQQSDFQDVERGISLLKKASKIDFSPASLALGKVYLNGGFVTQDLPEADKWLSNAFKLNNQQAIKLAHQLKSSENTEDLALPILYSLVEHQQNTQVSSGSLAPVNEMETITITAPQYTEYFDAEIARLNNSIPDTSSGTGSKIKGMTCAKSWGCSTEQDSDRIRDVLLSDWGLEAIQFRLE
ncbi:tetratricopeptide repeat protein [Shewanella fidelis]|uniref:Tetratricopeptide repeat protein n=1 Tax=Shewanella fidelis TaxID=173509 RepID=A0AAW8NPZ5_9GAMM|nr:tetratricopeptide repeat protein [Shewanella fidelis]MDR8525238.1 tetratricopeptide repeat protein [Shewanella fidelis]MDW4811309.1 tetratricopeptide repeat protein [Shewanella fidelis]MDW4814912.1 tetratricopeptide repeat protein [Shewanella fidelis]MDW4819002.1 tetratricopeptide repeat protein [Shewanella fidelis]MDW4823321.1 tetratricopeptide repeat protein [Shewanella fidelis]